MKPILIITPAVLALTLAIGPARARADAQDGRGRSPHADARGRDGRADNSGGRAVERSAPADRGRQDSRGPEQPRPQDQYRTPGDRQTQPNTGPRSDDRSRDQYRTRQFEGGRDQYRSGGNASRGDGRRGSEYRRYDPPVRLVPRYNSRAPYRGYNSYRSYRFSRTYPYRIFPYRPGLTFGIGIFLGRPYPYRFDRPSYGYGYPSYGYGYPGGTVAYGGLAIGISPANASVYVDGEYVGIVADFDGSRQPLSLPAGMHRIEIDAPGYEPMAFDVDIVPGQVIPYNGYMQPAY